MVLLFLPRWNLIAYANLGSTPELPKLLFSLVGWFAGRGMRHFFLQGKKQENRSADPEGTVWAGRGVQVTGSHGRKEINEFGSRSIRLWNRSTLYNTKNLSLWAQKMNSPEITVPLR